MGDLVKGGKFEVGKSGNPGGRPKGSKNKITLLKLMAEEASREKNAHKAQQVLDLIYEQALDGDKASQKLVWQAHISGASADEKSNAKEKVEININATKKEEVLVIDQSTHEDDTHE